MLSVAVVVDLGKGDELEITESLRRLSDGIMLGNFKGICRQSIFFERKTRSVETMNGIILGFLCQSVKVRWL